LQLQQKQDKDSYNSTLQEWRSKKQNVIGGFQSNPSLWPASAGICTGSRCEPVTSFFQIHENSNLSGWNKEQTNVDWETCLRKCKDRTDCEWVNWNNNGTCYINSLGNRQGSVHGFKTNNGYIRYSDQYIDGYTENLPNFLVSSADQCQSYCDAVADCKHWQWNPSDNRCWLQHVGANSTNMRVGVKMPKTNITFSDNDSYIIQQIGQPPVLQHTPVELSIVCQDCRQSLGSSQITDSTQVNMSQLNQCIANIKEKENSQTTPTTTTPTTTPTTTTPTTTTPTTTTPTTTTPTNTSITTTPITTPHPPTLTYPPEQEHTITTPTRPVTETNESPSTSTVSTFVPSIPIGPIIGSGVSLLISCAVLMVIVVLVMNKKSN